MKFLLTICILLFCTSAIGQIDTVKYKITTEVLQQTVNALAHDSMGGRRMGTHYETRAAEFIAKAYDSIGLQSVLADSGFISPFKLRKSKKIKYDGLNVIGFLPGKRTTDSFIIVSAHYDHDGVDKFAGSDSVFNGANDNASGVAALFEIAKYYKQTGLNNLPIWFVCFGGEERGLLGSRYFSAVIKQENVAALINIDMVGKPLYPDKPTITVVGKNSWKKVEELNANLPHSENEFFQIDNFREEELDRRTDAASFHKIKTAISFTSFIPDDPTYHTVDDEPDTLDYTYMLLAIENILKATAPWFK